jgi:hypothetical protein
MVSNNRVEWKVNCKICNKEFIVISKKKFCDGKKYKFMGLSNDGVKINAVWVCNKCYCRAFNIAIERLRK